MRSPIPHLTALALILLLANAQDEPQQFSNVSRLHTDSAFTLESLLNPRALECSTGYSECAYDTSKCCPTGERCCGNGYCAEPGEACCSGGGTCRSGFKCCAGTDGCAPYGGECCDGGYYCRAGKKCRLYKGERLCCALSGCAGENNAVGDDTYGTTKSVTTSYKWYTSTIYWTYWSYYWTSFSPYTVKTVTSTTRTTYTVWSVYATGRAVASSSLADQSSTYNFRPPFTATYLSRSSDPVTLYTGAASTGDVSVPAGKDSDDETSPSDPGVLTSFGSDDSATVRVSGTGVLAAVLVAAVGGLAFGL